MPTKLIGYVSLGYPTLDESLKITDFYLKSGLDVVEIGYPTDDAFLDNEFIRGTLSKGHGNIHVADDAFEALKEFRKSHPDAEMILLTYEHSIIDIGFENFVQHVEECAIRDIILVGSKDEKTKIELMEAGFNVSCYVTFRLPDAEISDAKNSNGFVYLQAKPDGAMRPGCETLASCIRYLRNAGIAGDIYAGVGINRPEDVEMVTKSHADGAFIGSALLKKTGDFDELKEYISQLKASRDNAL